MKVRRFDAYKSRKARNRCFFARWVSGLIIFVVSFLVLMISHMSQNFATWYATYVYPVLPRTLGWFFGLFPFSVFEAVLILLCVTVPVMIIFTVVRLFTVHGRAKLKAGVKIALPCLFNTLAIIFMLFVLAAGINYNRQTYADHIGITVRDSSPDELVQLYLLLVERAEVLVTQIETDESGHFALRWDGMHDYASRAMRELDSMYGALGTYFPRAKAPILSRAALSNFNIGGFFSPWTMEAHYNRDMPGQSIPFVIAHELAHVAGHMREDEANFIAYLASRNSVNVDFQYSAAYVALSYTLTPLRQAVGADRYSELFSLLPEQVRRDFAAARAYWQSFQGPAADFATRVNDTYLRLNQQEDGVRSYGRMVDLLLAYYREQGKILY